MKLLPTNTIQTVKKYKIIEMCRQKLIERKKLQKKN